MKYEALYSAVLGAAPTVLIGFVLEFRFLTNLYKGPPPRKSMWQIYLTIIGTSLSAIMSLMALGTHAGGDSPVYAFVVTLGLIFGITGLGAFMFLPLVIDARKR